MQEGLVHQRPPVPPVKRFRADVVQRPRDPRPVHLRHDQHDVVAHGLLHTIEERPRQIGPPPFPRPRVEVEAVERIPVLRLQIVARQPFDPHALLRTRALLADVLSLARGEAREKGIEIVVAAIDEVELPILAYQQPRLHAGLPVGGVQKGQVRRRKFPIFNGLHHCAQQREPQLPRRCQQARPRRGRERHAALQLRVIVPARAPVSVRPGVVEHILPLAVSLGVERGGGQRRAALVLHHDVTRRPPRVRRCRARRLAGV